MCVTASVRLHVRSCVCVCVFVRAFVCGHVYARAQTLHCVTCVTGREDRDRAYSIIGSHWWNAGNTLCCYIVLQAARTKTMRYSITHSHLWSGGVALCYLCYRRTGPRQGVTVLPTIAFITQAYTVLHDVTGGKDRAWRYSVTDNH